MVKFHEEAAEALIQLTSFESKIQESFSKENVESLIKATVTPNQVFLFIFFHTNTNNLFILFNYYYYYYIIKY